MGCCKVFFLLFLRACVEASMDEVLGGYANVNEADISCKGSLV